MDVIITREIQVQVNIVELRGYAPPSCTSSKKGGSLCPVLRHGAASLNDVPEKENGARALHELRVLPARHNSISDG